MSRILITGNSGLIGFHLVPLLESQGHEVLGVSRTNRHNHKNTFCTDLTNSNSTEFIFQKFKPEIVIHLAACAAEAKGQISPIDMVSRNLLLTTNVIRSSVNAGVKKIVYASSVSVYGDAPVPYSEESQPKPKDVYGVNKLAGEQVLKIMSQVYGFDYTILRPHNLYGPGQNQNDLTKNVVNIFMRKLLEGNTYTILGDGTVRRAFSYAPDVARVFADAVTQFSKRTFNVGSHQISTIQQLSDLLTSISGSEQLVEHKPLRSQEIDLFIAGHDLQDLLTEYHETDLKEGLHHTWNWMKKQDLGEVVVIPQEIYVQTKN